MWNWGFQLGGYPRGKSINSSAAAVGCAVSNCCSVLLSVQSYSLFPSSFFFFCMCPDPFAFSTFFCNQCAFFSSFFFFFWSSQCVLAYCKYTRPFLNLFCCCWVVFFCGIFFFFPANTVASPKMAKVVSPAKEMKEHRAFCLQSTHLGQGTNVCFYFLLFRSHQ